MTVATAGRWATVAVALLAFAAVPLLLEATYYTLILSLAAIYAIVGIGLNVLAGYAGQVSLGHAGLFAVGAYVGALLATRAGISFWLGVPLVLAASVLVGALLALPTLKVEGPYLAMVTIAFVIIVNSILVEWSDVTGGTQGILSIPRIAIGSFVFSLRDFYWFLLLVLLGATILERNLHHSPPGRSLLAVKDNELGAESVGLSPYRLKATAFMISAAFAGLAGTLFAHLQRYISPEAFDLDASFFFITIVILGGPGTIVGPILGALILTYLPELLQRFDDFRLIIYGGMIVFSLYFMPHGLVGALTGWSTAVMRRFGRPADRTGGAAAGADGGTMPAQPARLGSFAPAAAVAGGDAPLLDVRSVTQRFGGLVAVHDVDLRVEARQIHALIGPNGAGKTVLLNVVCGYYRPTAGEVRFRGRSLVGVSPAAVARRGIARTFQTTQLFPTLSVIDNVMTGRRSAAGSTFADAFLQTRRVRREQEESRRAALELLDFVGYQASPDEVAGGLPFGRQRLVEIARALALRPALLIMDEPAAGLNPAEIERLMELIRRIRDGGVAVLLVEHHMELVMGLSDVVTVLDYGEKIAEGTPAAVQRNERVIEAYLGAVEVVGA